MVNEFKNISTRIMILFVISMQYITLNFANQWQHKLAMSWRDVFSVILALDCGSCGTRINKHNMMVWYDTWRERYANAMCDLYRIVVSAVAMSWQDVFSIILALYCGYNQQSQHDGVIRHAMCDLYRIVVSAVVLCLVIAYRCIDCRCPCLVLLVTFYLPRYNHSVAYTRDIQMW